MDPEHPKLPSAPVETLQDYYALMRLSATLRRPLVQQCLQKQTPDPVICHALEHCLQKLEDIPQQNGHACLALDPDHSLLLDLDYEVGELHKDLIYLSQGEQALMTHLSGLHIDFDRHVQAGLEWACGQRFDLFLTDRDGTTNNYCGRYNASVQSVYNAVFLSRFARHVCEKAIMVTSAPLRHPGLLDVSTMPAGTFYYAASKGREVMDPRGQLHQQPVSAGKQALLVRLNTALRTLVSQPDNRIFGLIGSGLQFKFGQTTIARQDIHQSIPEEQSQTFRSAVTDIVQRLDPDESQFRIEDTGLDIEIILTLERDSQRAFDKGDSVQFITQLLRLDLDEARVLVCGDTTADLPMTDAVAACTPEVKTIMVTRDTGLQAQLATCPGQHLTVPTPDILVALLNQLAQP
jgi:hypothetical protein